MKEQNIKKAANVGQQQTATKANKKKKEERRGGPDEGQLHNTARHKLNFFFASAKTCREQNERVRKATYCARNSLSLSLSSSPFLSLTQFALTQSLST